MIKKEKIYTDDEISSLSPIEAMRFRPTVFIGETGITGVMHLLKEIITNSVDEFLSGYGKNITIEINAENVTAPKFKVIDEGRGIPLGKLLDSVSKMNTSGKYSDITGKGGYGVSAGLKCGLLYSNV